MADPRIKQIKIKSGIVKRITKEKISYEKEADKQKEKISELKASNGDEYYVRKQEEVLQESLMMVPDCQRRLLKAFDDLNKVVTSEKDLAESEEVVEALKILEEAKVQLPVSNTPRIGKTTMKIYEAKENIFKAVELLDTIKKQTTIDENSKQLLKDILSQFTPTVLGNLKKEVNARKKKRKRTALSRKRLKEAAIKWENEKKERNLEVQRWFIQQQEQQIREKTEESVKLQADAVLHEVRRKKLEARRILTILPALAKLRAGRCQRDVAEGGTSSTTDAEAFELALGHLKGLWERQLEEYSIEETGLKVMLEAGSATRLGQPERDLDKILREWQIAMFGEDSNSYLTWQELVTARQSWDKYVVAPDHLFSSTVPIGWLFPQPLNESWKTSVNFN